ncbi:MAG: site-2 protease family protein [Clostridiales bacterium]|nr:site-2 protease family protein [Clostridiales bacterium]
MKEKSRKKHERRAKERSYSGDEVRIYISPVMFVMAIYFVAMGMAYEFFCSLAAVLLHECAHARIARKLGYELNLIKLMPYGAALCGSEQIKPKHEILIALAGPMINLAVATGFAALWWLVPSCYMFTEAFCRCNIYIAFFNLLPVYPLDGGRVALAMLSLRFKRVKAYKIMRIVSAVFGMAALALFALSAVYALNLCLLSVGIFMLLSSFIPDKRAQYTALFALGSRRDRLKAPLEVRTVAVSASTELAAMYGALDPDKYNEFVVLDENTLNVRGKIGETELIESVMADGYSISAEQIIMRKSRREL